MPFPNEHAARQRPPGEFSKFRRYHPQGWPQGIEAIIGTRPGPDGTTDLQSIRAKADKWTVARFEKWLGDNEYKKKIEPAIEKGLWGGLI